MLGKEIRFERETAGLTLKDIEKKTGIHFQNISLMELGGRKFEIHNYIMITDAIGLPRQIALKLWIIEHERIFREAELAVSREKHATRKVS